MAIRNVEDLELDEITEDTLLEEAIELGDELGVDTHQGSLYRDACEGHILRIAKFFDDLSQVYTIISLNTCTGDVLDEKLAERGMSRNPAADTTALYYATFEGAEPEEGATVSCDDHYFTTEIYDGQWAVRSEETGTDMNTLVEGTAIIPEEDVDGLTSATLGALAVPAVDMEDDDSARERLLEMIAGPAENGNKTQIQSWCEGIEGVGRARIVPLWAGDNTVLGVITATDGTVPTDEVVALVQETIDPGAEGMGEGLATIGCFFTAVAAIGVAINVTIEVSLEDGYSSDTISEEILSVITDYLTTLALSSTEEVKVRYNYIGALITDIDGIVDYDDFYINDDTVNVECTVYQIPIIGEVTVNVS